MPNEASNCRKWCNLLEREDKEILVMHDGITGPVSPAKKRNIGISRAKGEYVAFIDADAYPHKYWLNYVVQGVAGWCGPGLIPPNSPPKEIASDWILNCLPFNYRVSKKKERFVNDYPTFNLIVKKSVLEKLKGFREDTLTGEDSDLCQRITDLGLKIVYIPWCIVYHKRRALFAPFLKQIATYAMHRGYFFRINRGSSRKVVYLLPSLCLLFILYLVFRLLF